MFAQLAIGLLSGLAIGVAVFSNVFARAMVMGLVAGAIVGVIMVEGVEGYVRWATYLPAEITRFAAFWIGALAGLLAGARVWAIRQLP
jgi:hypothetical protein